MIKKTFFFSGIIILTVTLFLSYINKATTFEFNYLKGSIDISVFVFALAILVIAAVATFSIFHGSISEIEQQAKKQNRKTEKASIAKEEAEDKVKLLEAKINTLEKALSEALKRN